MPDIEQEASVCFSLVSNFNHEKLNKKHWVFVSLKGINVRGLDKLFNSFFTFRTFFKRPT